MAAEQTIHLQSFIRHITTALATSLLYSPGHQQVQRQCASALESLIAALGEDPELELLLIDNELVAWNRPLPASLYIGRFTQTLKTRGISHLRILKGVSLRDIKELVINLIRQSSSEDELRSSENIIYGRVEIRQGSGGESTGARQSRTRQLKSFDDVPLEEILTFIDIYEEARSNNKLNMPGISDIVTCIIDSFKKAANPLMALAPLKNLDEYTFTHSTNVCILNLAQAMSLGIEGPLLYDIGIAAMLHDIGKLFVSEEILIKSGELSESEMKIIRQHPVKGAQHLLDTPGVPRLAVVVAYEHHMRYNFSGYPQIPLGWKQNLCSHMTTISDYFDAMRTNRSYRGSMEFSEIASIMLDIAGTELHPLLTQNFVKIIGRLSEIEEPVSPGDASPPNQPDAVLD